MRHVVERIAENCEPALCTVLFMAGAGGSLRAGVTENPVRLTRSVRDALTRVTCGGAPAYVWPGGGITLMVDVARMPEKSFGYVPTPALVAPIEFTMRAADYAALGGHASRAVTLDDVLPRRRQGPAAATRAGDERHCRPALPDGRLHLQHGPIDLIIEAFGAAGEVERAYGQAVERFGDILPTLVRELPTLRRPVGDAYRCCRARWRGAWPRPSGRTAPSSSRRWRRSPARSPTRCCRRWCAGRTLDKAYVNDGGDIALHLTPGHELRAGIVATGARRRGAPRPTTSRCAASPPRAAAGARSRWASPTAVTVLAATAAAADAAATLIANAVDLDHPAIERRPARAARSRQRPRRSAGHRRGRAAAGREPSPRRWTAVPRKRGVCGSAA